MKHLVPYIKTMLHADVNATNEHSFVMAGCAADYAGALGQLTQVLVKLTDARHDCLGSNKEPQQCAGDVVLALELVFGAIARGAEVSFQCFGLSWICAELFNKALGNMVGT